MAIFHWCNLHFLVKSIKFTRGSYFPSLKSKVVMAYFTFLLLRPCTKWRGRKNKNNIVAVHPEMVDSRIFFLNCGFIQFLIIYFYFRKPWIPETSWPTPSITFIPNINSTLSTVQVKINVHFMPTNFILKTSMRL